jgi:Adenylate and Guanylate cyclase catalytic domain
VNFTRVLKEVLWCLVTEGGISYRRIKLSYGLDDDAVEELRRELISIKQMAADADGERLVWAPQGQPLANEQATRPHQPPPPLRAAEPAPILAASPRTPTVAQDLPGAERRQLTVMFCDLADSTRLSAQLDPEEMGDVIRAYQEMVSEAVRRFDGFVAKFMGDGILVYFGYPYAQGNDAERAVHSGLAIIEAVPALNRQVERRGGMRLAVRIGVATGLVVSGRRLARAPPARRPWSARHQISGLVDEPAKSRRNVPLAEVVKEKVAKGPAPFRAACDTYRAVVDEARKLNSPRDPGEALCVWSEPSAVQSIDRRGVLDLRSVEVGSMIES